MAANRKKLISVSYVLDMVTTLKELESMLKDVIQLGENYVKLYKDNEQIEELKLDKKILKNALLYACNNGHINITKAMKEGNK